MSKDITIPEMDRRAFLKRVGIGGVATAFALASIKPVLAETVITDKYIKTGETNEKLAKSSTVVVGKSGAVDYLTTDYGSDDACIQAAIDYVDGLGGGNVSVREGTYTIENSLSIPDNICLCGCGWSAIFKCMNAFNDELINNSDTSGGNSNITISNIQIDGNSANQTVEIEGLLKFNKTSDIRLNDIYIHDVLGDAIRIWIAGVGDTTKTTLGNINISNIRIKDVTNTTNFGKGIGVSCGKKVNISNIDINNVKKEGIWTGYISECNISNAIINTARHCGIMLSYNSDTINISNVITKECAVDTEGGGININNSSRVTVTNHQSFNDKRNGILLSESIGLITISNSIYYKPHGSGIKINGLTSNGGTIMIDNCIFIDPNQTAALHGSGVLNDDSTYHIDELHVKNSKFFGDAGLPSEYDIKTKSTDTLVVVEGCSSESDFFHNEFIGVVGVKILLQNNPNFNPVGNFTAPSIPATTVNYVNAYGYPCQVQVYGGTVTEIDIDDIATGLTSGIFMLPPGGTINITYSAAPSWRWWGL